MDFMNRYGPVIGRTFLSAIFLLSGFDKIANPQGTQQYMAAKGMPATGLFLVAAILLELVGGLMLLLGCHARRGALLLILFLVPTTLIFHTDFAEKLQVIMFMKNLAILGGLLFVAAFGSGPFSLKGQK